MSLLTPLGLLGALIAIPILLLYMLRLRRREVVVSSNFLWQQIIRDREANTPWQRLRRNILLILQLIILALLVFALARPAQIIPRITSGKTVILLDASASMNAVDVDGDTRFQAAKLEALRLISDITLDDEISIIRVADISEPLTGYTGNVAELRNAINNAEAGEGRGDWDTALTLAAAGAEGAERFNIIIISDGGLGETAILPENIPAPVYVPIGAASDNLAISALATRTLPGNDPQLFAQVRNYAEVENEVSLLVRLDGEIWRSNTQTISANSQRSFVFEVDEPFTTIQAELVLDDEIVDYLDLDNAAYTIASDTRTRRVLLVSTQQNRFLEQALRSVPSVQVFRGDPNRDTLPDTPYDLYVFNGYLPSTLPDADMMIINPPTSSALFALGDINDETRPIELINRSHPVSSFINVNNINLARFRNLSQISWAETLIAANNEPIVLAGENAGRQVVLMPFNLLESDFTLNIAFPLMVAQSMNWFSPANLVSGGTSYNVGDIVRINPPIEASAIRVTRPDGESRILDITGNTLSYSQTQSSGLYTIEVLQGDDVSDTQVVSVNLFGETESNIDPVPEGQIVLGGSVVEADPEEQLGYNEWWGWLASLALIVLLWEWRVYFRRLTPQTPDDDDFMRTTAGRGGILSRLGRARDSVTPRGRPVRRSNRERFQ